MRPKDSSGGVRICDVDGPVPEEEAEVSEGGAALSMALMLYSPKSKNVEAIIEQSRRRVSAVRCAVWRWESNSFKRTVWCGVIISSSLVRTEVRLTVWKGGQSIHTLIYECISPARDRSQSVSRRCYICERVSVRVAILAKASPYLEGLSPIVELFHVMQQHHTVQDSHNNPEAHWSRGKKRAKRRGSSRLRLSCDLYDVRSFNASMNAIQDQHKSR